MKGKKLIKQTISFVLIIFMLTAEIVYSTETSSSNHLFTAKVLFWNEQGYCEYITPGKNILGVDLMIRNNSALSETIQPYLALYKDNTLLETKSLPEQNLSAGGEISYTESFSIDETQTDYSVKVFNWAKDDIEPLSESVVFTGNKTDFYGDSIDDAALIQNYNKEISGSLNTVNDTDYFKIIPESTSVFSINCFSTGSSTATLYNSSGTELESSSVSIDYTLSAENAYYVKISGSGNIEDYILSVSESSAEAANFNVYEFDEDVNVYKKSILDICDDLYSIDKDLSKQMYSEYEDILGDDAKLHTLPAFLADHPKDLPNFDDLINQYFGTKYEDFENIKQRYIALIDKYAEIYDTLTASTNNIEDVQLSSDGDDIGAIIKKSTIPATQKDSMGTGSITPGDGIQQTPVTPSLTIVSTTTTSITYNAVFPVSGQSGNCIYMIDFNANDGITTWTNQYGNATNRPTGQYTISNLTPGGIYILAMLWSTGENLTEDDSICRFVQLPNNTVETLTLYQGGRVTARLESADKALASSADFNKWLDRMDDVYLAYKELTGYTPYDSKKIEMRSTRENLNEMFDAVDGLNYFEVVSGYYDNTNIFKYSKVFYQGHIRRLSQDDWGDTPIHELSHVFDNKKWVFDAETLAQFKMYYIMEQLNAKVYDFTEFTKVRWYTGNEYYNYLKYDRYNESYQNSFEKNEYSSQGFAAILIDIQKEIGWEPFKKTFRYFSTLPTSQTATSKKNKLKLFLTKLKDYSGEDVLGMINSRDTGIIEDWYNVTLEYTEPVYPTVSGGGSSGGGSSEITIEKGNYSTYKFTPTESANYYIYTSPYGGSGVSNDTYIEVYTNSSLSGTPIASNDDYDGGRFSKVNVAMTEGTTYYIKVRHYTDGQLHAELNITKNIPVTELSLDSYEDINVAKGEYAMYSFTPENSMTYVFEAGNYNGEATEYDTYIKLYENESMTGRIGNDNKKIIVNLTAGHTYYLQFSGFLMKSAKGRISIRQGQTIEFTKSTDSNFIFVNSPEYITKYDIVDDDTNPTRSLNKIFEQTEVTEKNTYFQTHLSWYGVTGTENYFPQQSFYLDIDFYNESTQSVTLEISNLAYGTNYQIMGDYYKDGDNYTYTIEPGKHLLLFETLNAPLSVSNTQNRPTILFDFNVLNGGVTVSSLAAYSRSNLYLKDNTQNILLSNNAELSRGYPETAYISTRQNESDYHGKYKGTAWNDSAWIDANIEFLVDNDTLIGEAQPIYLKDDFYDTISNPKWSWTTSLNPIDDDSSGTLSAMPSALHSFKYPSEFNGKEWYFDFLHHDLTLTDEYGSGNSVNTEVSADAINELKSIVADGIKQADYSIDSNALSMGEWGATYHYTISVTNATDTDRTAVFGCRNFTNMTLGYKLLEENSYETEFHAGSGVGDNDWWEPVSYTVSAHKTIVFEVVTNLGVSLGGTNYHFVVR